MSNCDYQVSGTPHTNCHATVEILREDGLKCHENCLLCERYGVHCPVGSHPREYSYSAQVNHHHAHVIPFPTSNAPHISDHKLPEVISEPATVFGVHASHGLHLRAGPFCGFRVQLDHVNCVVDDLMKEHGGFRNYIKSEAEKRHLVGAVWRGNRKSVRIEVEGTHKNVSSFRHFLYELVTNEWVNHITTEESWEELRNVRLISTTFNIRKNSSKYTESGAFSDDGYEADVHSSADFIQA